MNKDLYRRKESDKSLSILVSAGHSADRWVVRGIAIGGKQLSSFLKRNTCSYTLVIVFTTILHGLTPRLGVYFMNVRSPLMS